MVENYYAGITLFAGNFAPRDYLFCAGGLLTISQNTTLFSLISNTYGGDGRTNFAVPDLRGRAPNGVGSGPGVITISWGFNYGREYAALSLLNLPGHNHTASFEPDGTNNSLQLVALNKNAVQTEPDDNMLGITTAGAGGKNDPIYATRTAGDTLVNLDANSLISSGSGGGSINVNNTGTGASFNIHDPGQGIYWIICNDGLYPSRN